MLAETLLLSGFSQCANLLGLGQTAPWMRSWGATV